MSYSTVVEVRNALSQAPLGGPWEDGDQPDPNNPTNTAADLTNDQLQDAIAQADGTIDAYLGALYTTPITLMADGVTPVPVPTIPLAYWSRDLAAYFSTLTFRKSQDFADQDPVARRYTATMATLLLASQNKIVLPFQSNTAASAAEGAGDPINPYGGSDMFQPRDFSLVHSHDNGWPFGISGEAYRSQLDSWPT